MGYQFYFGGTSLLILVGVAMDTVAQIEAQLEYAELRRIPWAAAGVCVGRRASNNISPGMAKIIVLDGCAWCWKRHAGALVFMNA